MTKNMTTGNPAKLILLFALPLIVGNIFQQFYNMADTMIVGRTIGVNALAAVGCTGSTTFLINGFVMGFTSGMSIVTARYFGAQDIEGVKRSFAISIILSFGLAVVLTGVGMWLARPMLELLNTPAEIIDDATVYVQIIFAGIIGMVVFNVTSNAMRALGDSRTPLYFLIFACCVNIVLDFTFILAFDMGVAGVGIATILAQLLSGLCCFWFIRKKMPALWVEKRHFRMVWQEVKVHIATAIPMGFQMSIIAIGSLILQFTLNGLGAVSVAAYTAAQKIDTIATMPMSSFGSSMATYSAQNYGAGKIDRIKKGVFQCILISVSFSIIIGMVNFFAGGTLVGFFIGKESPEVLELSQIYLKLNGSMYFLLALLFIYRFTLQGLGNAVIPTVAGVMELVMRAVSALVMAKYFGFAGACTANPLAWLGACIPLATAYYITIRKISGKKQD